MNRIYWERFYKTGYISDYLEYKISEQTESETGEEQIRSGRYQNMGENDMCKNRKHEQPEYI